MIRRSAARLAIWLGGRHVADLDQDRRGRLILAYTQPALDEFGLGGLCLSVSLPVAAKPYRGDRAQYWAEGLLPEGETRSALERNFGVARGDTFGLLAAIGRDCAGAIMILPEGEVPASPAVVRSVHGVVDVAAAIEALPLSPLGAGEEVRVSLGGLQSKLLLARNDGSWLRPSPSVPSTHILKPDPPQFQGLVAAEAFTLKAAAFAGMEAADVDLEAVDGRLVLIVTRFDRHTDQDGRVRRIHQEDGCQALMLSPERQKYQRSVETSPSLLALAKVLRVHGVDPIEDLARLLAVTTLHVAVGNTDAHARNHAFLHRDGGVTLTPLYDAAPTREFVSTRELALWVRDQPYWWAVTPEHLVDEAGRWGLPRSRATQVVRGTLERLGPALAKAAEEVPEVSEEIVSNCIAQTAALLARCSVS
jgi:serine/threonine-protein kinase HipA